MHLDLSEIYWLVFAYCDLDTHICDLYSYSSSVIEK